MSLAQKEKYVVIEVPQGMVRWVVALKRFYESSLHGSCMYHKKKEQNNIDRFVPSLVYLEDDEVPVL